MTEKKVTGRSALTRSERNRANNQSRAERGLRPSYDYRAGSYEAMRDRANAARDAARANDSRPYKPRPRGPNPYNMSPPPVGNLPSPIPSGLNPDGSIPGVLKGAKWGDPIPWRTRDKLLRMMFKLKRSGILGTTPWLRAIGALADLWDLYNFYQAIKGGIPGWGAPGWDKQASCQGGPGTLMNIHAWLDPNSCPPVQHRPASPASPATALGFPYWYADFNSLNLFGWPKCYPAFNLQRKPGTVGPPALVKTPYPISPLLPELPQFPEPGVVPPSLPLPFRNAFNDSRNQHGPDPVKSEGPQFEYYIPNNRPPRDPPTDHKPEPPPPGTKEKKVRVPRAVMAAFRAATEVTEAIDLVESLFDALPKSIQKQVQKSGRTDKRARIGEGKPYATALDKARLLWEHWDKLDVEMAVKNIAINHVQDLLIGRLNAGADRARDRMGGIGWGINV